MIVGVVEALIPLLAAWFLFDTPQGAQVIRNFSSAEKSVLQAPVQVAIQGWLIVAGVTAALGLAIWVSEREIGKKQGYDVAPPPLEAIHVAAGPSFGAAGETTVTAGPVRAGGGISSGGSAPSLTYSQRAEREPLSRRLASQGPKERKPSKLEREAKDASTRASIANSRASERRANQSARGFE